MSTPRSNADTTGALSTRSGDATKSPAQGTLFAADLSSYPQQTATSSPPADGRQRCAQCGELKPVDQFPPRRERPSWRCRACDARRSAEYYARNRERVLERQRIYQRARYWRRRLEELKAARRDDR